MASVRAHLEAGTLERGLPTLDLPALFLFGAGDPMPPSASIETAALIRGARVQPVEEAAHFPWLEQPGVVRAAVEAMLREAG